MADVEQELELHRACFRGRDVGPTAPCTLCGRRRPAPECLVCRERIAAEDAARAPAAVRTYDPARVEVTFNGVRLEGAADGTFIEVKRAIPTAWMQLARLAAHAYRHGGELVSPAGRSWVFVSSGGTRGKSRSFQYACPELLPDVERELEPGEEAALAETMMIAWSERFAEYERYKLDDPPALQNPCLACRAPAGEWCSPIHEGERERGAWQHPIRKVPHKGAVPGDPRARSS